MQSAAHCWCASVCVCMCAWIVHVFFSKLVWVTFWGMCVSWQSVGIIIIIAVPVAMAANVKVDRSIWRPSPAPHTRARTHTRRHSVQQWQFMFIELMLICAPRHDFLMECNFVSGRAVHISDLLYRTQRHWITDCQNDWLTAWVIDWVNDWITARMSVYRFGPTGVHSIAISNAFMLAVCQKPKPERQPKKKEKNQSSLLLCNRSVICAVLLSTADAAYA